MRIPKRPPPLMDSVSALHRDRLPLVLLGGSPTTPDGKYRHWDTLRQVAPPDGLTAEEWWVRTKIARQSLLKDIPLTDRSGRPFNFGLPDPALKMLHMIDQRARGEVAMSEVVTNPATRDRYIVSSLIEEAITSSQLEGAVTSRMVAKQMIQSGRPPRDLSERMILNNYRALQFVRSKRAKPLTIELLCQIQQIVTDGTLEDPDHAGRFQIPGDDRVRVEDNGGQILHSPPAAIELSDRMEAMCGFANSSWEDGFFHPVVRAILLHFWLAYDHPFADGNGRTARALFYWSMLNQGYWLADYLSISHILRQAPAQYGRAFLYTETDDNDATYFMLYQLGVISRAIEEFYQYLKRKISEIQGVEGLLRSNAGLNHRQLALLSHALRHPGASYTFRSHATSHGVVHQSARTDLMKLERSGLLQRRKVGRAFSFYAVPDLVERLTTVADVEGPGGSGH